MKFLRYITVAYVLFQVCLPVWAQRTAVGANPLTPIEKGLVVDLVLNTTRSRTPDLRAGDVLIRWERNGSHGEFLSPLDLAYAFANQAARGGVRIDGLRGNQQKTWLLQPDCWNFSVRPNFSGSLLSLYNEAAQFVVSEKWAEAVSRSRETAAIAARTDVPWLTPWILSHFAKALSRARQWNLSDSLYEEALDRAAGAGALVRSEFLRQWAFSFEQRDDLPNAAAYYDKALQEYRRLGNQTMAEANGLLNLAVVELKLGRFNGAEEHLKRAMQIIELIAPASIQRLLTIGNLAVLYQDEGQLEKAEAYYFKALDDEQRYFPNSIQLAQTLEDVGILFDQEGDLGRAEAYQRRALAIAEKLDRESLDVAGILASLADCLLEEGEPIRAEHLEQRALAIREKQAPEGLISARSLASLGKIARVRGNFTRAADYYSKSLAIAAHISAPGIDRASFLIGLGAVMREEHEYSEAENLYRQALAIMEKEDPDSIDRANTLGDLAGIRYRQGQLDAAAQLYRQAIEVLERQSLHLGGMVEARSRYRAEHLRYYHEYMALLLEQGHPDQAFELLEASRARTLFESIGEAHLDLSRGADPLAQDRERKLRQLLNAKSEYRIRLAHGPHSDEQLAELDQEIEQLLLQYQEAEAQLRLSSPRYASLSRPQTLHLAEIQKLLDPGTVLLEYSLGEGQSYVWAVTHHSIKPFVLPKRARIEQEARRVYNLLTFRTHNRNEAQSSDGTAADEQYLRAAMRLSQMILGPAKRLLDGKRLLIVADGALQYIPFAALPAPSSDNGAPLVVSHEIVNLPSASVLAELRQQRTNRSRPPDMVAVLADPVFAPNDERLRVRQQNLLTSNRSASEQNSDLTRSASDLGKTNFYLSRLLYTRNEANAVMAASQNGRSLMAVDFEANRALVTSGALQKYRIVHFATHGILNNRHPELSGLVLSLVDKQGKPQDGFLKLQDVYNLKLRADLVVLSGCQTGLGEQIDGEGIVGLTRGFMYAGATRVVASLWSVSDRATATLMGDFYKAMEHDQLPPAAALRAAQIKIWKTKEWSSAYYWAAFQIQGEWQ